MVDLSSVEGFEWDDGNQLKNWIKHQVAASECEQVFFNLPLMLANDPEHSQDESRYYVLGQTNNKRRLFISFTVRNNKIRVISARPMSRRSVRFMPKEIPEFKSEDEEREFWAEHDSADYLDWSKAERAIFPKLKPSTKTISLRMSESMLNELRLLANKRDVPYQSLIKIFLQERIDQELYDAKV